MPERRTKDQPAPMVLYWIWMRETDIAPPRQRTRLYCGELGQLLTSTSMSGIGIGHGIEIVTEVRIDM